MAFFGSKERLQHAYQAEIDELSHQLGQVVVERDWLKKYDASLADKERLFDNQDHTFSWRRQCELLGLNRSSLYYEPAEESEENLRFMRLLHF